MNAPLLPEILRLRNHPAQEALPLETEGVQRYVWESRFGPMLIEVAGGVAYVNGGRVDPVAAECRGGSVAEPHPPSRSST